MTYGELVARYEKAVGAKGTWEAKRSYDYRWEVIYTAPGMASPLWFGVNARGGGVYMDDISPALVDRMLSAIAAQGL